MYLVKSEQFWQTGENHVPNMEPHHTTISCLAVDDVVTHFAALSMHAQKIFQNKTKYQKQLKTIEKLNQ